MRDGRGRQEWQIRRWWKSGWLSSSSASARRRAARMSAFFFFSSRRRHTRLQGDWSSDVCSSDLDRRGVRRGVELRPARRDRALTRQERLRRPRRLGAREIGRASCRERGEISVVAVSLKKKKDKSKQTDEGWTRETRMANPEVVEERLVVVVVREREEAGSADVGFFFFFKQKTAYEITR